MSKSYFRKVKWEEVAPNVKKVAPDLFESMRELATNPQYELYDVYYSYGEFISLHSHFRWPTQNGVQEISSPEFDNRLFKKIGYNQPGVPLGLILEGCAQLFSMSDGIEPHAVTRNVFEPGDVLALNRTLDRPHQIQAAGDWYLTAGMGTPYMLAKIANSINFRKLAEQFDLNRAPPQNQYEHFPLFKAMADHDNFPEPWKIRILFLGRKWADDIQTIPARLWRLALCERLLKQTLFSRNAAVLEKSWETSLDTIRNKKVDRYILAMSKYIIQASLGMHASYQIADANSFGPFGAIANIISSEYGLKNYMPIIVVPRFFDPGTSSHAYISIQMPTINVFRKKTSNAYFLLSDYREISFVIKKFIQDVAKHDSEHLSSYNIERFLYRFYSSDYGRTSSKKEFLPTTEIFEDDPRADIWQINGARSLFTYNSFLRACIKVTTKK